jgi:limonene 1,2-monooxygenase
MSRPMRFSVFMQPLHRPDENPTLALERDLELIEHLDRLGYDEVWIGEHHTTGWETISSPAVFIASAAARTRTIKLGSGIVPLSIHHPFIVANDYILLDHLTRGRAMLGLGAGGGLPSDPYVFGLARDRQQPRFIERFDVLMKLLEGDGFSLREAVLQLRPYTYPHMTIALVTASNPETLQRIGRHGLRWLAGVSPDRFDASWEQIEWAAAASGRQADRYDASITVTMHIAQTTRQAIDDVRDGAAHERFEFSSPVGGHPLPDVPREEWIDHLVEQPTVIVGSPDDAIAKVRALRDQTGAGGLLITAKEWASPRATKESWELFARFVMPEFQGSLAGLRASEAVAVSAVPAYLSDTAD